MILSLRSRTGPGPVPEAYKKGLEHSAYTQTRDMVDIMQINTKDDFCNVNEIPQY